jgi:hypothetical protein
MASVSPKVGQPVRMRGPGMPGSGKVVAVIPMGHTLSPAEVLEYYGSDDPARYGVLNRPHKCIRIVIKRDDMDRKVIMPLELYWHNVDELIPQGEEFQLDLASDPMPAPRVPAPVFVVVDGNDPLHVELADLVCRFSAALLEKMIAAEHKHQWKGAWKTADEEQLALDLCKHVGKGDPLDAAAYAAFIWHHGFSTNPQQAGRPWQCPDCKRWNSPNQTKCLSEFDTGIACYGTRERAKDEA